MSKRTATVDLNQDNWKNEDDYPEERGVFQKASPTELKSRPMKRGRRRGLANEGDSTSIFKNFKGFGSANAETSAPTFSFLSDSNNQPKLTTSSPFPSFTFGSSKSSDNKTEDSDSNDARNKSQTDSTYSGAKFNFGTNSDKLSDKPLSSVLTSFNSTKSAEFPKLSSPESIKFGEVSNADKPTGDTFKFGVNAKETKSSAAPASVFKFGTDNETGKNMSSLTFKFGVDAKESKVATKVSENASFKFGESKETKNETTFKFGLNSANKNETSKSVAASPLQSDGNSSSDLQPRSEESKQEQKTANVNGIKGRLAANAGKENNAKFLAKLKALNCSVLKWVNHHLDKNPYINLKPIFDDYNKHFQEIKMEYGNEESSPESSTTPQSNKNEDSKQVWSLSQSNASSRSSTSITKSATSEHFVFGGQSSTTALLSNASPSTETTKNSASEVKPFTFGLSKTTPTTGSVDESQNKSSGPIFTFGMKDKPAVSKIQFSFSSSEAPSKDSGADEFSFNATSATNFSFKPTSSDSSTANEKKEDEQEPSDELPKEEVNEIKEDDAIYEKKVKLFYKKDEQYVDKGVGKLFLKPAGEKTQLVIRALTNLGTILLNIILNDSIPTHRVGKNNVLIACVPNPPLEAKPSSTPVSMLIRVKTEADADELLNKIDENKK